MFTSPYPLELTPAERAELEAMSRSRTIAAGLAQRARVILGIANGEPYPVLGGRLELSATTLTRWRKRFERQRIAGLHDGARSGRGDRLTPAVEAKILALTQQPPPQPFTHWTTRRLAARLGLSHMTVARVWQRAGLQPHRLERYVASPDPEFEQKAADVIGLYLNPLQHAAVFCVDEKTAIQALDRKDPILPLSPGRAERHGFEYIRHGTLSLYAALDTRTGTVHGKTTDRHTSPEFVAFLADLLSKQPEGQEVHIILDNLSAHKTKAVREFLEERPHVHLHFTPTYSSWLNQVELWFSKIERDLIHRGVFTSVPDLARRIMTYIRHYNKDPKPIKWQYADPSRRICVA